MGRGQPAWKRARFGHEAHGHGEKDFATQTE